MKKLLLIVLLLVSLITNSQETKLQVLTNEKEIAFLVEKMVRFLKITSFNLKKVLTKT